jgi:hypothetical protein
MLDIRISPTRVHRAPSAALPCQEGHSSVHRVLLIVPTRLRGGPRHGIPGRLADGARGSPGGRRVSGAHRGPDAGAAPGGPGGRVSHLRPRDGAVGRRHQHFLGDHRPPRRPGLRYVWAPGGRVERVTAHGPRGARLCPRLELRRAAGLPAVDRRRRGDDSPNSMATIADHFPPSSVAPRAAWSSVPVFWGWSSWSR